MTTHANPDAEELKQTGNSLFATKDYEGAIKCYTEAMALDATEVAYPLNRSFAYLKLQRWSDAERDTDTVLAMKPTDLKGLYRRALARKELRNFSGARADMFAFADAGGDLKTLVSENTSIAAAEAACVRAAMIGAARGYVLSDTAGQGLGAFANRKFRRGDLILLEEPLYTTSHAASPQIIEAAVARLTDDERAQLMELSNVFTGVFGNPFVGIHKTNAFAATDDHAVMCTRASRFNHSCHPNARYSWHAPTKTFRIYALQDIADGDEIFVSYLSSRNVYGSSGAHRQARLKTTLRFACTCIACTLPADKQSVSDRRRQQISRLWDSVPMFPPNRTTARLQAIADGVRLMAEEGYCADADDFTNDAAAICCFHSDWESARYWALKTYSSRTMEFGADSARALDNGIKTVLLEPTKHDMAAMGKKQVFEVRV